MFFHEVAFTTYPTLDLAASRAFYEGVLGLKPSSIIPMGPDSGWVEYELGSHTFGIGKSDGWKPNPDGPTCALETTDFDAVIAALRGAQAKFRMEPFDTPVCRMAMVFDPAGNTLIIHQRKPGHA
ncbi:MAG: VOC family protein [Verrucomicrobia bacterium]|nr:VOC family protein [Verrucomicrobiota bacterium]